MPKFRNKPVVSYLAPLDWIILEPDGIHAYPCKPDIFEAIHEPAIIPPGWACTCIPDAEGKCTCRNVV